LNIRSDIIAERYIDEHPLTMNIEGDQLITMFGQWLRYEGLLKRGSWGEEGTEPITDADLPAINNCTIA
jgi:hypothetical protein